MATTTRPKLSRKELKQPDEFISFLDQTLAFVEENLSRVIFGAVALVALLGIIFAFRFYYQHQQRIAAEDFYTAVSALERKDYKAAEQGFMQLADHQPGQSLGRLARFYLGSTYLDQAQPSKARAALAAYLQAGGTPPFTQLALCQLGSANEDLGDFKKARDAYAHAAALEGPERERAALDSARMLALLGDRRGAIAAYQAFLKTNPYATQRPDVVEALANLGATPEGVKPTNGAVITESSVNPSNKIMTSAPGVSATPGASTHTTVAH